jgi:protein O-mannosyl-transferase
VARRAPVAVTSAASPAEGRAATRQARRAAVAVALLVAAVYAPTLRSDFVWDDWTLVAGSDAVGDASGLVRALGSDLYASNAAAGPSGYWRPLATASFWLNSRLGDGPLALHAGNVVLHAITAGLLALLLARVLRAGALVAALAALLWAIHPEQVEAVAWISCRYELLAALAAVAYLLLPKRPDLGSAAWCGGVFLAGLLSKESFLGFAAVVLAEDWAARRSWRESWRRWAAVALAIVAWMSARRLLGIRQLDVEPTTLVALPGRLLSALAVYAARAVAPLPLSIHQPFEPGAGLMAAGAAIAVALLALAWRRRELAPAVALFVAGLAPTSIAMARMGIAAERYFYLPSLGVAWLLGALLAAGLRHPRRGVALGAKAAAAAVLVACVAFTVGRLAAWRDDDALFRAALEVDPGDAYAHLYLGREALKAGRLDDAREHLERSQASDPASAEAADALAEVHLRRGDVLAARAQANRAVELEPAFTQGWLHLAWACHAAGDHRCELAAADRATSLTPGFVPAGVTAVLARCEVDPRPSCEAGLDALVRAGAMAPDVELIARATAAVRRGDVPAALERIEQLRRAMPGHPQIAVLEGQVRALQGR